MKVILINTNLTLGQFNLLIKSLDFMKISSCFLDNGEFEVEAEELKSKLLNNFVIG